MTTFKGHTGAVYSVAFSPNGQQLASGSHDNTIKLWDARAGGSDCVATFKGHTYSVWSVAFSPDGQQLASGSRDSTVKLWDARAGGSGCVATFEGHTNTVYSVDFSPNGQQLASASPDDSVKLWDARAGGGCVATFGGHRVYSVAFSPDGSCLHTNMGTISLCGPSGHATTLPAAPQQLQFQGYGVSADRLWIKKDGRNLLWLPSEYRPETSSIAGATVAIGCASGRVLFFRFSGEENLLS